ncbi:MAG: hypothetical protein ABR570_12220 [Burkholderiales bacterium]
MLEELLALNRRAAAQGNFQVAYHVLMAALHWADHMGDLAAVERIGLLGVEQGEAVERVQPPHQLSRAQAALRGQTALFDSFATHVEAVRLRVQSDAQRAKRQP